MVRYLSVENYKSIVKIDRLELGRVNVFIGANGSGKSNLMEAVAMLSAAERLKTDPSILINKGVRVTRPNLTLSSFIGINNLKSINISLSDEEDKPLGKCRLISESPNDIYSSWKDETVEEVVADYKEQLKHFNQPEINFSADDIEKGVQGMIEMYIRVQSMRPLADFTIYNTNTNALRGITNQSNATPLGVNGEGLDVLIANLSDEELAKLKEFNFIPWLKEYKIDREDNLKAQGHKLGHSKSTLYFVDKYMNGTNNIFSAENANEGALHILFYLTLMISSKTPSFFAIDNIDNTLNPRLCERLIANIATLAKERGKQVLVTTHNPASLDGLDLTDDNQRLFVVKRSDEGHTKVERIKMKPSTNGKKYNLSQLFIEGYVGGLNDIDF